MTTNAYKPLVSGSNNPTVALTNAAATYYTVPSSPDNTITHIRGLIFCNTNTSSRTIRVHNIASGGSAAASNAIIYDATIAANTTEVFCFGEGVWVMTAAMFLQALASASGDVTMTICGQEVAP